ncbi:MAG: hypothetical protein GXZ07_00555 [Firmicutes bacterium]|nr:hypothetical protein [Bacillota bacterium]
MMGKKKKNLLGIFLCFFLVLSVLTLPVMRSHMIFAYNMNNLFRSTTVGDYGPDDYYLISRDNTSGHLRIF